MTKNVNTDELLTHAIFEQAAVGIAHVVSATGKVRAINQRYCEILGYTMEELEQFSLFEITHPDDLQACQDAYRRLISGENDRFTMEKRYCRKDGSIARVRLTTSPLRSPGEEPFSHVSVVEEITERKQLDEILRFKNFSIDNISEAIHWTRVDGSFWDCNAAACTMLGYTRGELLSLSNHDIDPDYSDADRQANLDELRRTGKVVCQRRFHTAKGGRRIPVEITSNYFSYHDREYVCSMVKNISELVKAEKEASFYKALVEFSRDQVYAIDINDGGRMFYANQASCAHFGVDLEKLLTMRIADWDPAFDVKRLPAIVAEIRQGKAMHLETTHLDAGGRLIPVEVTRNIMEYDGRELLYGYCLDISERKAMIAALKEIQRNLVAAQRIAHIGNCVTTLSGRFHSVSEEFTNILGVAKLDFPGTFEAYLDFVHPDDRERLRLAAASIRENHVPNLVEYRIIRHDGAERVVQARGDIALDDATPDRIVITIQDITEQKLAEAEYLEWEKALLHTQKLESLGIMAGGIAHDFNNMLTVIIGNLQLFLLELPLASPGRDRIEQAERACRRAADLANQMLVYSGKGLFQLLNIDINKIVRENAELFRSAAPRNIILTVDAGDGLPQIMADPGQIQQVVMNLIANAAEAVGTKPGMVKLTTGVMECDDDFILKSRLVEKPPPGRFCYIQVSDNGCGMGEETLQRLFDPFFTTKCTGRGLGLAATQGIVRSHRGIILLESEQGKGTTFRILFPVAENANMKPQKKASESALPGGTKGVVLVADDEEDVRSIEIEYLRHLGFEVLAAGNGVEALDHYRQHADDIVLVMLDLIMPDMDGAMAFHEIRMVRSHARVLVVSGHSVESIMELFPGEKPDGFIQKPFDVEGLREKIMEVIG